MKPSKVLILFSVLSLSSCLKDEVVKPLDNPSAAFYISENSGRVPFSVSFQSTSSNVSHKWEFGDGTNSTLENPEHTFTIPGNYKIKHTITRGNTTLIATDTLQAFEPPTKVTVTKVILTGIPMSKSGGGTWDQIINRDPDPYFKLFIIEDDLLDNLLSLTADGESDYKADCDNSDLPFVWTPQKTISNFHYNIWVDVYDHDGTFNPDDKIGYVNFDLKSVINQKNPYKSSITGTNGNGLTIQLELLWQ